VTFEDHSEQVVDLALKPVGHFPDTFDGGDLRVVSWQINFEHDLMIVSVGKQVVNDLEFFFFGPIERGQIGQYFELKGSAVAQEATDGDNCRAVDCDIGLRHIAFEIPDFTRKLLFQAGINLLGIHRNLRFDPFLRWTGRLHQPALAHHLILDP
jgi:hypothetical protein